jgi:GH25 family lysozyme M1 (1,4-beta-N-acetylmuramidase)
MRSYSVVLLAAVWISLFGGLDRSVAQTVHAVLVADTLDGKIGAGVVENKANIKSFLANVQTLTGLNVASTEVDGTNFNCRSIIDAIKGLNVSADDVVFFYYAGHGFRRDSSQTEFPEFFCGGPHDDTETLSQAVDSIKAKQPRLIIAIADACNKITEPLATAAAAPPFARDVDRKGALLRLFKEYRGILKMSGAIPGQYSWYMTAGSSLGGFFTNQLLEAINANINRSGTNVGWEAIAADAIKPIYVPAVPPVTQNPQSSAEGLSVGPVIASASAVPAGDESQDQIDPAGLRSFWAQDNEPVPAAAAAPPPFILTKAEAAKFNGTFGIDLSHYAFDIAPKNQACQNQQGYLTEACSCVADWQAVSKSGVRYVYSKASDGSGVDLSFAKFWSDLRPTHEAKTLFRGAFHFLRPGVDPDRQADAFLRAVGALNGQKPAQLSPVLDIEWSNRLIKPDTPEDKECLGRWRTRNDKGDQICDMWYAVPSATIAAMAKRWIDRVEQATGLQVTIYTNPTAWWNPVMSANGDAILSNNRPVWTSRYTGPGPQYDRRWGALNGSSDWKMAPLPRGASYPRNPPPARYYPAHFWQFTESGFLESNFLTCDRRSVRKAVDINFIPVGENNYPAPVSPGAR